MVLCCLDAARSHSIRIYPAILKGSTMKRSPTALLCLFILKWCAACNGSSAPVPTGPIQVNITNAFSTIEAGSAPVTLTATLSGDLGTGLTWTLSIAGAACSPGCGTLKPAASPSLSAVYTPPATPPQNQTATITARSVANSQQAFVFNFEILPAIVVNLSPKFQSVSVAGAVQNLTATVSNGPTNAGVTWTMTAGGVDCQQPAQGGCGTLTVDPSPSLTAHYQPPATPPSAANASPTITATSVADATKKDSFNFSIITPPLTVTILNKFPSAFTGDQPITVNASLTNDFLNQGVTWAMASGGAACTAACGTLTPVGSPSTSATYTPPPTPQAGPTPSPTVTATSVSDNTKSDSFTFSLIIPNSLVNGHYAFLLRGYDHSLQPMALAGSLAANGMGNITGGEYDLNDNTAVTHVAGPLSGSYTVDTSFAEIPRVTFNITSAGTNTVLKCALSSDGKRAKVIELDASLVLNAGSLLLQDPAAITALAASTTPTNFAFGLDSDAPINARVVEAGQFILGPGAASVMGGIADEGQAGATSPIFGGLAGAAAIAPTSSSATPPDTSGRGSLTLSIGGSATQYAYYLIDSSQLNLIEIDAGGALKTVQAGTARNQKALSAASIQATSVVALTGMTTVGGAPSPDVIIGVLSNPSGTAPVAHFDSNNAGTVATKETANGSFAVPYDSSTGRGVIAGAFFPDAVFYLYDAGSGFIADVTPSSNGGNHGFSGPLIVQSGPAAGFSLQSLSGKSIGLAGGSSNSSMANLDLAVNFDGAGNYATELDFTISNTSVGTNGQGQNFVLNANTCACTYQLEDPSLGRGELGMISSFFDHFPNQSDTVSFYLIAPNQFVAIEDLGLSPSGILFFDPQ